MLTCLNKCSSQSMCIIYLTATYNNSFYFHPAILPLLFDLNNTIKIQHSWDWFLLVLFSFKLKLGKHGCGQQQSDWMDTTWSYSLPKLQPWTGTHLWRNSWRGHSNKIWYLPWSKVFWSSKSWKGTSSSLFHWTIDKASLTWLSWTGHTLECFVDMCCINVTDKVDKVVNFVEVVELRIFLRSISLLLWYEILEKLVT